MNSDFSPLESVKNVCLSDQEVTFQAIETAVLGLWDVINGLTRIPPPKHDRYRVTIFGSARIQRQSPLYLEVRHLASELTLIGCDIITGGGPGLMEAANEGSALADPLNQSQSIGVRVDLETEQVTNAFVERAYQHRTFFSRLHHFVLLSDAFVVVPGGIGTTLETLMIWQLLQVRQLGQTPLILVGKMWFDFVEWARLYMVEGTFKLADPEDMVIPHCVADMEAAIGLLKAAHQRWKYQG